MQLEAYGSELELSAPKRTAQAEDRPRSDALVIFGFTGDLASKKIFPALYAMVKRGALTGPVIGVASSQWSTVQLHRRVRDSVERDSGVDDKLRILEAMKSELGERLTTAFPRQGHYAFDPANIANYRAADITVEHIGDLANCDLAKRLLMPIGAIHPQGAPE